MAIFMLLLLSGLGILTIKMARISAKHFADSFIKEQAQLFMDSAIELAILKVQGWDRSQHNRCLQHIDFLSGDGRFEANVTILSYYLFHGKDNNKTKNYCGSLTIPIQTEASHGYVLMDVTVQTSRDAKKVSTPVRITRRTLQRP